MTKKKPDIVLFDEKTGLRHDGRRPDQLRPIKMAVGVIPKAQGSALVEMGRTKVVAAVYGPRETLPRHVTLPDRAIVRLRYHMAPFSTAERRSPAPTRREIELSKVLREAVEASLFSELFPRTTIDIFVEVLQADGGTRTASLNAVSLALADAGMPMRDLIAAVAVGKVCGRLVVDLDELEDNYGEADMPVAAMPGLNKIVLLQLNGTMTKEELREALQMASKALKEIYLIQKQVLREKVLRTTEFESE